jgi:molecular chaperone DnaK
MKIRKTVGIDLGTTNSVIALLDAADSTLLTGRDDQGRMTFPSVIGYDPLQQRLVTGRSALAMKEHFSSPVLPLSSVKRFMGLERDFHLGPETLTPPQASAHILRLLRDEMARALHDDHYLLDSAIITMPAYFNHNQIEATRQAGELAGFEVVELLHEPTAAAIYYSWVENHGDATYLVYDLGGGTFDVSIIRRRLDDYEVLSVSGDPFLGGDDFDRLLASDLIETGSWTLESGVKHEPPASLFDPTTPHGAINFARLVHIAEGVKIELSAPVRTDRVERYIPGLVKSFAGEPLTLEVAVERARFERLIKDKVDRTIDCCHEALARAREKAGIRLNDIDYIVLVGGSSRVPLVRDTVREAFCSGDKPDHVKCLEPLLHEPDLCVAYGAALRAATHGTRYLFPLPVESGQGGAQADSLELHWTSPANTGDTRYQATGMVRLRGDKGGAAGQVFSISEGAGMLEGGSVRLRDGATGMVEEAFLDSRATFAQDLELQPGSDNAIEAVVCDGSGRELARALLCVRHQDQARPLGQAVLPTQLITKPLGIEVLNLRRQRVKQVVAGIGATLPGSFECICRTQDQAGRIVVPIYEENRVVKQMVIEDLDPRLPIGSPVAVEFTIDVKHNIEVRVRLRGAGGNSERTETASIEAPPPPRRPTRADIEQVQKQIEELLGQLTGNVRSRLRARSSQLSKDLQEALRYDDEPKAIQRMAELRELQQQLELSRGQMLDPPWPRFAQLVRHCLDLVVEVANSTGRDRQELFEHVQAQERYGEQAYEEHNQPLYRECRENLEKYMGYLEQLLRDTLPRPSSAPTRPPEEEAKADLDRFRAYLATVWKNVRAKQRNDLEPRLKELAGQGGGLTARLRTEPLAVLREVRRLAAEIHKIEEQLDAARRQSGDDDAGLLEGSS